MWYWLLTIVWLALGVSVVSAGDTYFYGKGEQISLLESDSLVSIRCIPDIDDDSLLSYLQSTGEVDTEIEARRGVFGYDIYHVVSGVSIDSLVAELNASDLIQEAVPVYRTTAGDEVLINNQVVTKFYGDVISAEVDSALESLALTEVYVSNSGMMVLSTTVDSPGPSVEVANTLYESGLVQYSHPDFVISNFYCFTPNDSYLSSQYYLNNATYPEVDIDATAAWEFTLGDTSVVLAVIDDGLQYWHEDLDSSKFYKSHDFVGHCFPCKPNPWTLEPDSNVAVVDTILQAHGMCVMGIISATTNNGIGIAGIAPGCRLMPLKHADDYGWLPEPYPLWDTVSNALPSVIASAIEYAYSNGADVINGSWGWPYPLWADNVADAVNQARAAGVTCVMASGNENSQHVRFPASMNVTIAVGAVNEDGGLSNYANYGYDLSVVAPAEGPGLSTGDIYTLDLVGDSAGYHSDKPYADTCNDITSDYICSFGGTSATAPQVTAIAGLVISRFPNWVWSDWGGTSIFCDAVRDAIQGSAVDQVGDSTYDTPGWDQHYGYGLANAYRAILSVSHGDVDNSGTIDIADLVYLTNYMFNDGPAPYPDLRLGDISCDGSGPDIADLVYLANFIGSSGSAPPCPCHEY